jgi:hypothetical protein
MRSQPIFCRRQTGRWRSTRPSLLQGPLECEKIGSPAAGGPACTLSSLPHLGAWRACCVHIQIMERGERVKTGTALAKSAGNSALHLPYCPPLHNCPPLLRSFYISSREERAQLEILRSLLTVVSLPRAANLRSVAVAGRRAHSRIESLNGEAGMKQSSQGQHHH